jgi:hypothetical protein
MSLRLRLITLLLLVSAAACTKRIPSPTEALDAALADVADRDARARAWALAGLHTLFSGGPVDAARTQLDAAVQKDANDPCALDGQLLLAQRRVMAR